MGKDAITESVKRFVVLAKSWRLNNSRQMYCVWMLQKAFEGKLRKQLLPEPWVLPLLLWCEVENGEKEDRAMMSKLWISIWKVIVQACILSLWMTQSELRVQGYPGLQSEIQSQKKKSLKKTAKCMRFKATENCWSIKQVSGKPLCFRAMAMGAVWERWGGVVHSGRPVKDMMVSVRSDGR